MRNRVGLYLRGMGENRRYLKPHSKNFWAIVDGKPVYLSDGVYHLRYNNKWERLPGLDYAAARLVQTKREAQILAGVLTVAPPATEDISEAASLLADAIEKYLANIAALKSQATSDCYSYNLKQFRKCCSKTKLREVDVQDLRDYIVFLKKQDLADRTISNRLGECVTFLRHYGIKDVTIRHRYVEKKIRSYRPDELKALFAAAAPREWLLFQFFLCSGCREQECMHAEWRDLAFVDSVFTITN